MKIIDKDYWTLLCYCTDDLPMICGVYASKEEAKACGHEVKDCPAKHTIKKCSVTIEI